MKSILMMGLINVPLYISAREFSDTFGMGALAGIMCVCINNAFFARAQ